MICWRRLPADGLWIDRGGAWIGPGQDRIYALMKEFGVSSYKQYTDGQSIIVVDGKQYRYKGTVPLSMSPWAAVNLGAVMLEITQMCKSIPLPVRGLDAFRGLSDGVGRRPRFRPRRQGRLAGFTSGRRHGRDPSRARRAVVAVPIAIASQIIYEPMLPVDRSFLHQRMPSGAIFKINIVYEEPFWRADGLSGQSAAPGSPATITIDASTDAARPGVLA